MSRDGSGGNGRESSACMSRAPRSAWLAANSRAHVEPLEGGLSTGVHADVARSFKRPARGRKRRHWFATLRAFTRPLRLSLLAALGLSLRGAHAPVAPTGAAAVPLDVSLTLFVCVERACEEVRCGVLSSSGEKK